MKLKDKIALVTGSTGGIGAATARALAGEGARVIVAGRDEERGRSVVESIRAEGGTADFIAVTLRDESSARALASGALEIAGRVDILVNNAGVMVSRSVMDTTEEDWDRTIDVNLKGAYLCSKEVVPIMLEQKTGKIINMSSNSGLYHPSAMRFTEYVVSKAGMNGLTKAMALALGPHITVNAICPGWIKTEMIEGTDPEVERRILAETALGRWGTPDEIAGAALFLASKDADFITGELLIVAGGRGMH